MTTSCYWNVFVYDDDLEILTNLKTILNDETIPGTNEKIRIRTCNDFESTLLEFDKRRIDIAIVDVKQAKPIVGAEPGTEAGEYILKRIREKKFIPVIFFTAWPHIVKHLQGQYVKIIEKSEDPGLIIQTIRMFVDSQLPSINRALTAHMEKQQADYMWDFVSDHWNRFEGMNPYELAYVLARRMSLSLSDEGIKTFLKENGAPEEYFETDSLVHPMQYYVNPPIAKTPQSGDLYLGKINDVESYWCLLTPSCDLVPREKGNPPIEVAKADLVVLTKCILLKDQPEFKEWQEKYQSTHDLRNSKYQDLESIFSNNRRNGQSERFVFLPGVLSTPDLIIDFQQLFVTKYENVRKEGTLKRIATIDPPFSDSILIKFSRYFGRVGTPDLNCACVISKYKVEKKPENK